MFKASINYINKYIHDKNTYRIQYFFLMINITIINPKTPVLISKPVVLLVLCVGFVSWGSVVCGIKPDSKSLVDVGWTIPDCFAFPVIANEENSGVCASRYR